MSSAPHHHSISGLLMSIATALLFISILSVVGAFLWKTYLSSAQTADQAALAAREKGYNLDQIQQLETESAKISLAKQVLANHVAASQVFGIIGDLTAENVRFMSLDFTGPAGTTGNSKVTLSGVGASLSAVAFQSDILATLSQYGLSNIVKNPILSNPALNSDGTVAFSFSASIDPSALSYEKEVASPGAQSQAPSSPSASPQASTSSPSNK